MRLTAVLVFALLVTACGGARADPPSPTPSLTPTISPPASLTPTTTPLPSLAFTIAGATSPSGVTPTQPPITGPEACQVEGHGTSGLVDAIPDVSLAHAYAIDSTVVVARVTGVLRPLAADDPQLSVYSAEVTDAVTGELHTGDTFALWQNGGLLDGIVYEQQEDPMVRLGCSYLFMLEPFYGFAEIDLPEPWGQSWAFPMSGRFNITEDGRLAPTADYWSAGHPATDLVGLTLNEEKARFRAVAAQVTPVPRPTPAAVTSQ